VPRERQREGRILRIEFHNFCAPLQILLRHYKCAAHLQKTCWNSVLTDSTADITLLSVRSTQLHTQSICWHEFFEIWKSRFKIPRWNSITLNFNAVWSGYTSYSINTNAFLTIPIYYKLKNAQWSDQHSVHKIYTDIHLM
jgi:hypothetical protein